MVSLVVDNINIFNEYQIGYIGQYIGNYEGIDYQKLCWCFCYVGCVWIVVVKFQLMVIDCVFQQLMSFKSYKYKKNEGNRNVENVFSCELLECIGKGFIWSFFGVSELNVLKNDYCCQCCKEWCYVLIGNEIFIDFVN